VTQPTAGRVVPLQRAVSRRALPPCLCSAPTLLALSSPPAPPHPPACCSTEALLDLSTSWRSDAQSASSRFQSLMAQWEGARASPAASPALPTPHPASRASPTRASHALVLQSPGAAAQQRAASPLAASGAGLRGRGTAGGGGALRARSASPLLRLRARLVSRAARAAHGLAPHLTPTLPPAHTPLPLPPVSLPKPSKSCLCALGQSPAHPAAA
jgi:hypothetical protein